MNAEVKRVKANIFPFYRHTASVSEIFTKHVIPNHQAPLYFLPFSIYFFMKHVTFSGLIYKVEKI